MALAQKWNNFTCFWSCRVQTLGSIFSLCSRLLVFLPHVRVGIPAVVCGELLGDYHSLGAAEPAWIQTGVAWQTAVAGVSLPGLKDWLGLTCSRAGSTVDRGVSQLHRISCGYSHTSKGITLPWAKKIGFSELRRCGCSAWWDHADLQTWITHCTASEAKELCFLYISLWYLQIWAKPRFALRALPHEILLKGPVLPLDTTGGCNSFRECRMALNQHLVTCLCNSRRVGNEMWKHQM